MTLKSGVDIYLVTQVGVDTHKLTTVDGSDTLHVDGTGTVALAVTAGSVNLAVVVGVEVDDVDVATAVVLNDLVLGAVSTATNDVGSSGSLDGDSVLADLLEPNELQVAAAQAVDTLLLVGTDDDVLQGSAVLEDEDGIGLAYANRQYIAEISSGKQVTYLLRSGRCKPHHGRT